MTENKPRTLAALKARHQTKQADDDALTALYEAIVDDLNDGVPQTELCQITGYTREHIRKVTKAVRERRLGK